MRRSRRTRRAPPTQSPTGLTLLSYVVALIVVLFFHHELGESAAGCFGTVSPAKNPPSVPEEAATEAAPTPRIQVRSEPSKRKEGLDTKDGIVENPIE